MDSLLYLPARLRCLSRRSLLDWDCTPGWKRSIREPLPSREMMRITPRELISIASIAPCATGSITSIAKGMYPRPPQLLDPRHMVTDDPAGESYWKVSNGIRLTGMPSFHASLSDTQIWQVSLLLANADKLPPSVNLILAQPFPMDQPAASSAVASHR